MFKNSFRPQQIFMIHPIYKSKLAEGGQSFIYYAEDYITGRPLIIKACKSHINKKYIDMLKREYDIMHDKLRGLDCIVQALAYQNTTTNPQNPFQDIVYPEHFIVMDYAQYGSLHELYSFTK